MFGLLTVIGIGAFALYYQQSADTSEKPSKLGSRLDKLWQVAHESLRERKYLRAEKALLTILRVDERNSTAYNRLGILYAKQRAYEDAIECFEIAQSLDPNASSLHNVGLIYLETDRLDKAALAFEQALEIEDNVASRHIAYAKVLERLGNDKKMIESLERAVALESNPQSLGILAEAYQRTNQDEMAEKIRRKINQSSAPDGGGAKTIKQPRKVVM